MSNGNPNPRGVIAIDVPTSLRPVIPADSGTIVCVAAVPIHSVPGYQWKAGGYAHAVNRPVLCEIASDFTTQLGLSDDWLSYHGMELYDAMFIEGNTSPGIWINPYDPFVNSTPKTQPALPVTNGQVAIADEVIMASLVVTGASAVIYHESIDFTFVYDDDTLKSATLNVFPSSPMYSETTVNCSYSVPDLSQITADEIIGGVDVNGNYSGLEVLEKVYTVTGHVPATVITPGFGDNDEVIAAANSKVQSISNGRFRAVFLPDFDTATVTNYDDLFETKNNKNMVSGFEFAGWPLLTLGTKVYHFSTIMAVNMLTTDATMGQNIPYVPPSNKVVNIDGCCLADGTRIDMDLAQSDAIENWGLLSVVNQNGWRIIGDYTCAYPADTDIHDYQVNQRRMFNWLGNTLSLTLAQFIDLPGNLRTLASIGETIQQFGNSLVAVGASNTFRVRFLPEENLAAQVMAGIYKYHILWTPPTAVRTLDLLLEYSVDDLTAWISQVTIPGTS
jgi:phage tail sheath protein FI